ncbi:MAG: phosphate ABC transporter permease subunit PstC, partial [Chloroflexi bacterium]|nr:phosphate ABC transporter permease subunit PstC [Chloroflexota bacterium]
MEREAREPWEAAVRARISRAGRPARWGETVIRTVLLLCSLVSILTTIGIIYILISESIGFFRHVSVFTFLTDTQWTPLFTPQHFGLLPLLSGTLLVAALAALVAMPLGLGTAIYLSEYAPDRLRRTIKPVLELLAGVPTV